MSEEINELMDAFLALCLEQKKLKNEQEKEQEFKLETVNLSIINQQNIKHSNNKVCTEEELKNSALVLAKKLYTKAAELERSGKISKAIELYNRAYRLDPEIDRNINHEELAAEISKKDLSEIEPYYKPFPKASYNNPIDRELYFVIYNSFKLSEESSLVTCPSTSNVANVNLFKLPVSRSANLLQELPVDVLDRILQIVGWMHLPSLEVISKTSRFFFLACRQDSIWKFLCSRVECRKSEETGLIYDSWRHQFISRPHFRTDGLYISKITYFRQGYQETAISQPSHLITYFRYLRFFNDAEISGGKLVMSFVSTEQPRKVIDQLKEIDIKNLQAIKERFFNISISSNPIKIPSNKNGRNKLKRFMSEIEPKAGIKPNLFIGSYWRDSKNSEFDRIFHLLLFDAHSKKPMKLRMKMELGDPEKGPGYRSAKCLEYFGNFVEGNGINESERVHFDTQKWGKFYFSRVKAY